MMASPNPPPVLYGPNVAQVKPMIQTPQISSPVTTIAGIIPLQAASTGGQTSQLCGQSLLTAGVAPGRYRYNTASMNGKQGVLMLPVNTQGGVQNSKFFIPFTKKQTTKTGASPQPTIFKQSDLEKPLKKAVPIKCSTLPNPGRIMLTADKNLKNVYRTHCLPKTQSIGGIGIVTPQIVAPPGTMPNSLTSLPPKPLILYGNTQQRIPVNTATVLKSSSPGQNNTVVKFVIDRTPTTVSLSPMTSKSIATNSIVKTEPPDYDNPVGKLLIEQSPDSSVSEITNPSTFHTSPNTSKSNFNISYTSPSTSQTDFGTSHMTPSTSHTYHCSTSHTTHTSWSSLKPVSVPEEIPSYTTHTSWSSLKPVSVPEESPSYTTHSSWSSLKPVSVPEESPSYTTHTSWPALKPVSVPEESLSLTEVNNTENVLTENLNTIFEEDNDLPFKIDSVFSLCGSNFTEEGDFIPPDIKQGVSENNQELNKGEPGGIQDEKTNEVYPSVKENEPQSRTPCKYNKACFPVIENLKLHGLPTVDVRKLRKITGRQSCSQKCREKTVERYCRLDKLCIKEKPVILDFPLLTDSEMEPETLQQFEVFLKICKPAPRSKKVILFRQYKQRLKYSTKLKAPQMKAGTKPDIKNKKLKVKMFSYHVTSEDEFAVIRKKKKKQRILEEQNSILQETGNGTVKPEQVLPNKAVSLLNPEGSPTTGWLPLHSNNVMPPVTTVPKQVIAAPTPLTDKAVVPKVQKPVLDTKSPAFQKAVSALGSKKFFLLRVDGKNILMPVEQNSVVPRAYVLGDTTTGVSSQMYSPVTKTKPGPVPIVNSSSNTEVSVKTEPPDTGYETPVVTINNTISQPQTTPVRVKQEPTCRGYSDEINMGLTNASEETIDSGSDMNTALTTRQTKQVSISSARDTDEFNMPSTSQTTRLPSTVNHISSADRIRKLKELLKKNEEELEMVKRRRIEEAVDVSGILDDSDI